MCFPVTGYRRAVTGVSPAARPPDRGLSQAARAPASETGPSRDPRRPACADEPSHVAKPDPRKRVREPPGDRHRGVGERSRGGEPIGADDIGADRERHHLSAAREQPQITASSPNVATPSLKSCATPPGRAPTGCIAAGRTSGVRRPRPRPQQSRSPIERASSMCRSTPTVAGGAGPVAPTPISVLMFREPAAASPPYGRSRVGHLRSQPGVFCGDPHGARNTRR